MFMCIINMFKPFKLYTYLKPTLISLIYLEIHIYKSWLFCVCYSKLKDVIKYDNGGFLMFPVLLVIYK